MARKRDHVGTVIAVQSDWQNDDRWHAYFDTSEMIVRIGNRACWRASASTQIMHTAPL